MLNASIDVPVDRPQRSRIVLIGFMGAGKTTLAREWIREVPHPAFWFDSDVAVCKELEAESVSAAFRDHGEQVWRSAEREIITRRAESLIRGVEVWSLGGGALLDPDVQRCLLDATVVWLDASPDVLWDRVQGSDRPLARDRESFLSLYAERRPVYESLATVRIDTDAPIEEVELPRTLAAHVDIDALCSGLVTGHDLIGRAEDLSLIHDRSIVMLSDTAAASVTDRLVDRLYAAGARLVLDQRIVMGEWHKQLSTVEQVVRAWSEVGINRSSVLIAVGGGTLLDVAGFAASIWQRGIEWISVPTTLTAQVDAGVGGKTGVNLGGVKNVLGTVHMPMVTLIDPAALTTLDDTHVADGFIEVAKTALLAGEPLTTMVHDVIGTRPGAADPDWLRLIDACAWYKDRVVSEDPLDTDGIRAQLNLGHTLGHAIEAATAGAVSHGRAVAIGIHAALRLSVARFEADADVVEWWLDICSTLGIPVTTHLAWEEIEPWLSHDKKHDGAGIRWVLLRRVGTPVTGVSLQQSLVQQTWDRWIREGNTDVGEAQARRRRILVLFGVNLGELGHRDPAQYGSQTLADLVRSIEGWASEYDIVAECRQTDSLERFIGAIHEARDTCAAVIVNPGAWTHHEHALHDALEPLTIPRVEVHISDITSRESWRRHSVIEDVVDHRITGRGADGYRDAISWIHTQLDGSTK
jgi:shikimate kinase/3-dehydroquinate synthase